MEREIHITAARKRIFEKQVPLFRDLMFGALGGVPIEITKNGRGGERILVKGELSEKQEMKLREIWEATMPPALHADAIRKEREEVKNGST